MAANKPPKVPILSVPVLHPPLLAIYRVLLLYANNMNKTPLSAVVRPALVLAVTAVALWLALWVVLRNKYKAGIVASILIVAGLTGWHVLEYAIDAYVPFIAGFPLEGLYFLYAAVIALGLLYIVRQNWNRPRRAARLMTVGLVAAVALVLVVAFVLGPAYGEAAAWAIVVYTALVVALITYVLRWKGQFVALTQTANWFAVILVAISIALIVVHRPEQQVPSALALEAQTLPELAAAEAPDRPKPDIYLIVFEGYARADVLRQEFGYNNMPFFNAMSAKGFWVADKSFSNYSSTVASMASCLNMDSIQSLLPDVEDSTTSANLLGLLHHNRVYAFLKGLGYETCVFSPGAELLEPRENVDRILRPAGALSEFESVLLDTSFLARGLELRDHWRHGSSYHSSDQTQRERVAFTFDELCRLAEEKSERPRFVYAHLLVPEPPFLFGRDGSWPKAFQGGPRTETTPHRMTMAEYRQAYSDQLHHTNAMLTKAVNCILEKSASPPAILVVSGRGPNLRVESELPAETRVRQQLANLVMARLPDGSTSAPLLPDDNSSLVNLFRGVFNRMFETQLPLVPPQAYSCTEEWPVEFEEVPVGPLLR